MGQLPICDCTMYSLSNESDIVTKLEPILTEEGLGLHVELYDGEISFVICGEKLLAHSAGSEFGVKGITIFTKSEWRGGEDITPDWDAPERKLGDKMIIFGVEAEIIDDVQLFDSSGELGMSLQI